MHTVNNISEKLKSIYNQDTCYHGDVDRWSKENPTIGHCAVASLLIQSIFGGKIAKTTVKRHSHYFNILPNGEIFDATAEQFYPTIPSYKKYIIAERANMLKNQDTKARYTMVLERFISNNTKEENKNDIS